MPRRLLAGVVAVCLICVGTAGAEVITHSGSGLQFELPDNWTYEQDGDLLTASSRSEDVVLFFFVSQRSDAEEFIDALADELDAFLHDAEVTQDATQEEVNGLSQIYVEGTGTRDGEPVDWDLTLVIGGRRALAIVAVGDIASNQDTVHAIYGSVSR